MELKEFVRDVLVQIAEGVRDADEAVSAAGVVASPAIRNLPAGENRGTHFTTLPSGAPVFLVDFDVATTVREEGDTGANARLQVAGFFSPGIGATEKDSTANVSRVRSKVPMALPVNAASASSEAR
jgi:hypothetical protein